MLTTVENRISNAKQELEDAKTPEQREADAAAAAAGLKSGDVEKAKKQGEGEKSEKGEKKGSE